MVLLGSLIDTDHWRHFYLLMGLVWGMMTGDRRIVRSPRIIADRRPLLLQPVIYIPPQRREARILRATHAARPHRCYRDDRRASSAGAHNPTEILETLPRAPSERAALCRVEQRRTPDTPYIRNQSETGVPLVMAAQRSQLSHQGWAHRRAAHPRPLRYSDRDALCRQRARTRRLYCSVPAARRPLRHGGRPQGHDLAGLAGQRQSRAR